MQETPPTSCCRCWSRSMQGGTDLRDAGRGRARWPTPAPSAAQDYVGFHTFMALAPGLRRWSRELPEPTGRRCRCSRCSTATPTASRSTGGREHEVLHPVAAGGPARRPHGGEALREATRGRRHGRGRADLRRAGAGPIGEAFNDLQYVGAGRRRRPPRRPRLAGLGAARPDGQGARPHAAAPVGALLRATRRAASRATTGRAGDPAPCCRKLLDQYKLLEQAAGRPHGRTTPGSRAEPDDLRAPAATQAADAVAAALAEGIAPEAVGEAISLAANQLVLRDPGRPQGRSARQAGGQRPRRLGRRPRLRRGQRLAEHRPRQQPAQRARQPDRRRLPHRPARAAALEPQAVPAGRAPARRSRRRTPTALLAEAEAAIRGEGPGPRLRRRPRATASSAGAARARSSTCCCATPSARTARCTPRSTTAR